jgi:hypothetical protein
MLQRRLNDHGNSGGKLLQNVDSLSYGQMRYFRWTNLVIVAHDRHGAATDVVRPKLNRLSITAALNGIVTFANYFCCNGGTLIVAFVRRTNMPMHILPLPGKPKPYAPDFHINNVNAYHD